MYLVRVYLPYCISLSLPPPHTQVVWGGGHGRVGMYLRESRVAGICGPGGGSHDTRPRDGRTKGRFWEGFLIPTHMLPCGGDEGHPQHTLCPPPEPLVHHS